MKPFGFMLVAYSDPLHSSPEVGRLIHPFEREPDRWLESQWADLHDPTASYRIGVRDPSESVTESGVVYVKTYRDVLRSYLGHPESKSTDAAGGLCRRSTKGELRRRPVEAATVTHIGKEANFLEDRRAGLMITEEDYLLRLGSDTSWEGLVVPAVRRLGFEAVRASTRIPESTLSDLISLRTRPQRRHEVSVRRAVHALSGEWLKNRDHVVPGDSTSRLATFVAEYDEWSEVTASYYEWAVGMLSTWKKHPGSISRVAQQSGVSRRRIWKLRDPELREKVVSVVALYALKGEPP